MQVESSMAAVEGREAVPKRRKRHVSVRESFVTATVKKVRGARGTKKVVSDDPGVTERSTRASSLSRSICVEVAPTKIHDALNELPIDNFEKPIQKPTILAGDFNHDMRHANNKKASTTSMKDTFNSDLRTDTDKSTTKNYSCIDWTFARNITHDTILINTSYISYHHPSIICMK